VTMSVIGATEGRFLPVRFTEVANGQALNGLEIGPRVAAPQTVFYENLLLHAAVFHRLQILFSLKAQEESKEAVELAKSDPTTAPYVKFMKSHGKPIAVLSTDLLQLTPSAGDPFGIKLGILRLQTALKNGNPVSIAIAHAALLEKLEIPTLTDKEIITPLIVLCGREQDSTLAEFSAKESLPVVLVNMELIEKILVTEDPDELRALAEKYFQNIAACGDETASNPQNSQGLVKEGQWAY